MQRRIEIRPCKETWRTSCETRPESACDDRGETPPLVVGAFAKQTWSLAVFSGVAGSIAAGSAISIREGVV